MKPWFKIARVKAEMAWLKVKRARWSLELWWLNKQIAWMERKHRVLESRRFMEGDDDE